MEGTTQVKLLITTLLLLAFTVAVSCQNDVRTMPDKDIKIQWDGSGQADVQEYAVFYVQGADTTLFPFTDFTDPYELWNGEPIWNWSFARTYEHSYAYIPKVMVGVTYLRMGVAGINKNTGQMGLIRTLPYCIKIERPDTVNNLQVTD